MTHILKEVNYMKTREECLDYIKNNRMKIYEIIGKLLADKKTDFNNIQFREDCTEYLEQLHIDKELAFKISEEIRKGKWTWMDSEFKKTLPNDFVKWAEGVKYLASRTSIVG